jgi:hypothetical protein
MSDPSCCQVPSLGLSKPFGGPIYTHIIGGFEGSYYYWTRGNYVLSRKVILQFDNIWSNGQATLLPQQLRKTWMSCNSSIQLHPLGDKVQLRGYHDFYQEMKAQAGVWSMRASPRVLLFLTWQGVVSFLYICIKKPSLFFSCFSPG